MALQTMIWATARRVSSESGVFDGNTVEEIVGAELQRIRLDHLLALSMPIHPTTEWNWTGFVVVCPEDSPSFRRAEQEYHELLGNTEPFAVATVESLLDSGVLPEELTARFRERYVWESDQ